MAENKPEEIAQQLGRPAQTLSALAEQSPEMLDVLLRGISETLQQEKQRLETAYHRALPNWLYRLIVPWLRRSRSV